MSRVRIYLFGAGCAAGLSAWGILTSDKKITDQDQSVKLPGQALRIIATDNKSEKSSNPLSSLQGIGVPQRAPAFLISAGHVSGYDYSKRIPSWVFEHLTAQSTKGDANRKKSKFQSDNRIPALFSASNKDYRDTDYSRGHMAPAGDYKNDQRSMNDSFLLTNVVPQNRENNSGFWNRLEIYCRDLTKRFKNVYIFTGPLFVPIIQKSDSTVKKYVRYEVIGTSNVAVPTHLFKIIIAQDTAGQCSLGAFVVPNENISSDAQLRFYQVPLEEIESVSGLTFLGGVDRKSLGDLCVLDDCNLINQKQMDVLILIKKLHSATTRQRLDTIWKQAQDKALDNVADVRAAYENKQTNLKESDHYSTAHD